MDTFKTQNVNVVQNAGAWIRQKGTGGRYESFANNWKRERREPAMKEGDIFESLLNGTDYVVKGIADKMVVLPLSPPCRP